MMRYALLTLATAMAVLPSAASAQEDDRPTRVRVGLGPQIGPAFPGSDDSRLRPLISLSRAKGDDPFGYGAPGDGPAFPIIKSERLSLGPAFRIEGRRRLEDAGGGLTPVGRTIEVGAFMAAWPTTWLRLRGDVRKGLGGHKGVVGTLGADYVARDADRWLFSIGPRATIANARRERAYFGVDAESAARTGLARYDPDGGVESVGVTSAVSYALTPRWGVQGQVQYARLSGDAGDSPVIRRIDSRDQLAVGAALTYTFFVR
jgi:outer membrane protein